MPDILLHFPIVFNFSWCRESPCSIQVAPQKSLAGFSTILLYFCSDFHFFRAIP